MTIIYAATEDQHLIATILPRIAEDNVDSVRLRVVFDGSWDLYPAKSAIFTTSKSARPYPVTISTEGNCLVPPEVLAEECKLYIVVKGENSATGAKKSSTRLTVKVRGGHPAVILSDPTPSVYQQLLTANAVITARLNQLIAAGTIEGAEVIDIRTDAAGKVYNTAGEATRAIGYTLQGLMQKGGAENPLQPLMFSEHVAYKGGTSYQFKVLSAPGYTVGDVEYYNSMPLTEGTSYAIGGKLAQPIPTFEESTGQYYLVVESDAAFRAYIIMSSQGNWGLTAKRLHSVAFTAEKGFSIIPLALHDVTPEGITADYYNYVLIRSDTAFSANFKAYLVHGGGVLGWLTDRHQKVEEYITCWGDSLTAQAGWTTKLQELSGMTVYNAGTGGENVRTITARQGADVITVDGITIPAGVEPVTLATYSAPLKTAFGHNATPLLQGGAHVNPVKLGNVEGTLKWTGSSYSDTSGTWTFTRSVAGEAVSINRPTALTTAYDREKNAPHLMVIFMGQNKGYNSDEELVDLHRLMIDHAKAKHVIVLGLSSGSAASRADYETAMRKAFGRYFISLREYLSQYGLADAGLTPTTADTSAMDRGEVPPQLLADAVHYTAATKTVIGNLIYKRCCELGIFNA